MITREDLKELALAARAPTIRVGPVTGHLVPSERLAIIVKLLKQFGIDPIIEDFREVEKRIADWYPAFIVYDHADNEVISTQIVNDIDEAIDDARELPSTYVGQVIM